MLKMTYVGSKTEYNVNFKKLGPHRIELTGNFPVKEKGFILSRAGKSDAWDRSGFKTVYRRIEGGAQFSDDGSVWIPTVNFTAGAGGTLEGDASQNVYRYEDLNIPTPQAEENYEFDKWSPEIPESGEITSDTVNFTALFTSTLPPAPPEPSGLDILEERVDSMESAMIENYETQDSINQDVEMAIIDLYETVTGGE